VITTEAEAAADEAEPAPGRRPREAPTLGEVVVLLGGTAVAVVAWMSLATAQLGVHGRVSVVLTSLLLMAVIVVVCGRGVLRRVRVDWFELATLAVVGVLALVFFLPGFPYAVGDKDPGAYVQHGFAIAREGSVWIDDPVLAQAEELPVEARLGARFPAVWPDQSGEPRVASQFYHLFSALLATAHDFGGDRGLFNLNPLVGAMSVLVFALVARRLAGPAAGVIVGLLLAANMLQVWQAKTPSTEILTQLLFGLGLLAVVVAVHTSWRQAAALGGLAVGVAYLTRPDAVLFVALAALGLAVAVAIRRGDDRVAWFAGGLAVTLPHGFLNAYVARPDYTLPIGIPGFPVVLAGLVGLAAGAFAVRHWWPRIEKRLSARVPDEGRRLRLVRGLGLAVATAFAAFLLFCWLRPQILGRDASWLGITFRSYDEENLRWLALFVTIPGIVLAAVGVGITALRPQVSRWIVALVWMPLIGLYLWEARIAPRMMWWGRRFVPAALPVLIVLAAVALAWLIGHRRWALKVVGAGLALFLLVTFAVQSLPLRSHREWANSRGIVERLSDLSGDERGVYLWAPAPEQYDPVNLFGGGVWLIDDQVSARLPDDATAEDVLAYQRQFPGSPVFVITPGTPLPDSLGSLPFESADRFSAVFPFWEESRGPRPEKPIVLARNVWVWRLPPGAGS
jgi:hypothetical protein